MKSNSSHHAAVCELIETGVSDICTRYFVSETNDSGRYIALKIKTCFTSFVLIWPLLCFDMDDQYILVVCITANGPWLSST